ncbi:hypothetical protein ACO0KY_18670 [Undibacterium sp. Dicai25W]
MFSQNVVSANDKPAAAPVVEQAVPAIENAETAVASIALSITSLVAARKEWEAGVYRTSSLQLYSILANCLSYYDALKAAKETDLISVQFKQFCEKHDITFKKGTQQIYKVVKCVFYDEALDRNAQRDRRRISAYATVLRLAISNGITAEKLVSWIEDNGGIEDIRVGRAAKENAETAATQSGQEKKITTKRDKADAARAYMLNKPVLGIATGVELAQQAPAECLNYDVVLIARQRADGTFAILGVVREEAVVVSAQSQYFEQNKAALTTVATTTAAANDASARDAAINAASAA